MQTPTSSAAAYGSGMPGDRLASYAAGLAFGNLKRTFLHVLSDTRGVENLRRQVERADEPVDLWLLRASTFAVLQGVQPEQRSRRQLLRRSLDTVFPDRAPDNDPDRGPEPAARG